MARQKSMIPEENADKYALTRQEEQLVGEIRALIQAAREKTLSAVNSVLVQMYWQIGERIVRQEQRGNSRADYGSYLIKKLSIALAADFGGGFSLANLKNFRQFYLRFPMDSRSYELSCSLSWSHLRHIMRLDTPEEREYYLVEARAQSWTVRELERKIRTKDYQRLLSTKKESEKSIEEHDHERREPLHFIKDPYILEFLGLPENGLFLESDLESSIISHLQKFLLEMGRGFSFVDRQMRISTETSHFYIDLVFYNYLLKCFVLIDLKTTRLTHQDIGQMEMYVRMFDDLKRRADDNPTVGIILCTDRDETMVKYSVLNDARQIFASKYKTVLPTEDEIKTGLEMRQAVLREAAVKYGYRSEGADHGKERNQAAGQDILLRHRRLPLPRRKDRHPPGKKELLRPRSDRDSPQ